MDIYHFVVGMKGLSREQKEMYLIQDILINTGSTISVSSADFIFLLDKVFTSKPDIFTVMFSKIQGEPKNFAALAFGLQLFVSILEISYVFVFLRFAFGTDYRYFIGIGHIKIFHLLSSLVQCKKKDPTSI